MFKSVHTYTHDDVYMYKDTSIKNFPQEWVEYPPLMPPVFLMAGVEPRVAGILAQVPLPAKAPPSLTNLGVHTLWEVPLWGRCWCSPLQVKRAQRILLRNAVYGVMRWLASVTSKFSVCNPGLAITEIFKIPARIVLLHSGYNSDKGCFELSGVDRLFPLSSPTLARQQQFLVGSVNSYCDRGI